MRSARAIRRFAPLVATLALAACDVYTIPVSVNGQQHTLTVSYTCGLPTAAGGLVPRCDDTPSSDTLASSNTFYQLDGNPAGDFTDPKVIAALAGSFDDWDHYTPGQDTPPALVSLYTDTSGNYALTPPGTALPPTASTLSSDVTDLTTTPPLTDTTAGPMAPSN